MYPCERLESVHVKVAVSELSMYNAPFAPSATILQDSTATFISDNVQKKWGYSSEDFINDSEFWLNHKLF